MKTSIAILSAIAVFSAIPVSRAAEPQGKPDPVSAATEVAHAPRAATPEPKNGKENWMPQHEANVTQARKGGIDLLFIGDSLTKCWLREGREVWTARFAGRHAANFGISGDATENVLWRMQNGELDNIHPKAVVLLIGTNNITVGDSPADIAQAVRAIVEEIRRRLPNTRILLLGILPRRELANHRDRETIRTINRLISRLHDGDHVTYLDFGDKLLQSDGSMTKELTKDFTHLTAKGYEIFAGAIQPVVESLLRKP